MPSFTQLFTLAALATVGFAAPSVVPRTHCSGATLVHNTTLTVGSHHIQYTSHSCAATKTHSRRGLFDSPPLCILFNTCKKPSPPPPTPPPAPQNVCGVSCALSCNNSTGILPPISDDCQTIEDAITIFQGQQADTFTVDANHLETLTFGTCSYFFENAGDKELEYCWSDLSTEGSAAGSACFPPNQPFFPEGLCSAYDGTWAVGATHS